MVREAIISIDDQTRRLAFTMLDGAATHHNASMQVVQSGAGARIVWLTDVLPDSVAAPSLATIEKVLQFMKATLEQRPPRTYP